MNIYENICRLDISMEHLVLWPCIIEGTTDFWCNLNCRRKVDLDCSSILLKQPWKFCKERKMIKFCCLMKVQRNFLFNFDETRQEWQSFWNHQLVSKHNIKRCVGWWVTALLWNYNCSPNNSTQPLLIIYSDKQIKHKNSEEKNNFEAW